MPTLRPGPGPVRTNAGGGGAGGGRPAGGSWLKDVDVLFAAVALFLFLDIGRIQQIFPVLGALRPALLLSAVSLVALMTRPDLSRRLPRLGHPLILLILAITAWGMLTIPGALTQGRAFGFFTGTFVKTVVMVVVIFLAVRNPRDGHRLAAAIFWAIAVYGVFAVRDFEVGVGERLGELYTYDANDIAQAIVTVLPIGVLLARRNAARTIRLAATASLAILLVLFVRTGSRGGFLGMLVVLAALLFLGKGITFGKRLAIGGVAVGVLAILGSATGYWSFIETMGSLGTDYNMTSPTGRMAVWKRGVGYMLSHPLMGVGIGNFPSAEGHLSGMPELLGPGQGWKWSAAHNAFVQIGAEMGFPGLILYTALWALALKTAFGLASNAALSVPVRSIASALGIGLLGFLTTALFLSMAYSSLFYTLVALVAGIDVTTRERRPTAGTARRGPPPGSVKRARGSGRSRSSGGRRPVPDRSRPSRDAGRG